MLVVPAVVAGGPSGACDGGRGGWLEDLWAFVVVVVLAGGSLRACGGDCHGWMIFRFLWWWSWLPEDL